MKKILFFIAILGTMTVVSCHNDEPTPQQPTGPKVQPQYSFSRAVTDGATYGFVSYKVVNGVEETNPSTLNNTKPYGSYIYRDLGLTQNILEPCEVDTLDYTWIKRDPAKGQHLDTATYKTYCISPAAPQMYGYEGSSRVRFPRDIDMYASKNPFDMKVTGYNVFEIPDTIQLYPIQARMSIDIVQGATSTFVITEPELVNGGTFGFFSPQTRTTEISYSSNPGDFVTRGNTEDFSSSVIPTGNPQTQNSIIYQVTNKPVFAQKYVTGYMPLAIQLNFKLAMNGSTDEYQMGVPLGIDMLPGTHYKFTIVVKTIFVQLYYCVTDWETGYNAIDELGGDGLKILLNEWCLSDWENGYISGTPEDIGDQ